MIIAIDGPAGSGKSSVAKKLADDLGIIYINSGNIYRVFTYGVWKNGIDAEDTDAVMRHEIGRAHV
jgi:cytidylate kinase